MKRTDIELKETATAALLGNPDAWSPHGGSGCVRKIGKILAFVLVLLIGTEGMSQNKSTQQATISGYVKDLSNGEDLIGATIYFKELDNGVITNVYGFYSFTAPVGTYTVTVSYIGFQNKSFNIDLTRNQTLNIELPAQATELEEIVIVAEDQEENHLETTEMSVSKLSIKAIKKLPAVFGEPDILKSIQLLPGVTSVNEGASGFNVRGGSADQNLVLLDEATVYNTSHLFGLVSVFNPDAIKDVKLYKGGIPAMYGGRLSSVLDVRQREGNTKEFGVRGAIGTVSSRLTVEAPFAKDEHGEGKGTIILAGRRSYADVFTRFTSDLKDVSLFFYDFNLKSSYRFNNKDRLFVSGYFGRDVQSIPRLFGNTYGNNTVTVRWNHLFSDKLFSNFTGIYSKYNYSLENRAPGSSFEWVSDITNWTGKADFTFFPNPDHTVQFGVSAIRHEFNPGSITPIDGSNINARTLEKKFALEPALYFSDEFKLSDNLSFNLGLRYSRFYRMGSERILEYANNQPSVLNSTTGIYENGEVVNERIYGVGDVIKSFGGLEPRASVSYKINNKHAIKASYNRNYQYVHLISNTTSSTPLDIWSPSGPYKDPQIGDQYAVGYFTNLKDNALELSVELFYKNLQNQLDYVDGAELTFNNNIETELLKGSGRAYGLEVLLKKSVGRFTGWMGYTYSVAERKVEGINNGRYYPANYNKLHDLSITTSYELSKRWSFSTNFVFNTGAPITYPIGKYEFGNLTIPRYDNRNQDRLPSYHRMDLSFTRKGKLRKNGTRNKLTFGIYNVYNRSNAASITFREKTQEINRVDVGTGVSEAVKLYYFGIFPSVSYEFKF